MNKFLSRKFILTVLVVLLSVMAPFVYKKVEVTDQVTLMVLAILGGVGVAYGFINLKASKEENKSE